MTDIDISLLCNTNVADQFKGVVKARMVVCVWKRRVFIAKADGRKEAGFVLTTRAVVVNG